jgi:small subunit ribosomal protein S6
MIILEAGLEEDSVQGLLDRATQLIRDRGGNPGQVDRWGRRRFAYELNHKWEGFYVVIEFTAEPSSVAELDRMLKLADEVIRHKVIRLPEKVAGRERRPRATVPAEEVPEEAGVGAKED